MKIVIIGAGQMGRLTANILRYRENEIEIVGLLDDNPIKFGQKIDGISVLGDMSIIPRLIQDGVRGAICSIGKNQIRENINLKVKELGLEIVNAIHPSTIISPRAKLGSGVLIQAGVVADWNPVIGDGVIIGVGVAISHDTTLEANVLVGAGSVISGGSRIQEKALVGSGSTILQGVVIGKSAVVGAGAVVTKDVPEYAVVAGVPARVIRYQNPNG